LAIVGRLGRSLGQTPTSAKSESDRIHFVTPRHRKETVFSSRLGEVAFLDGGRTKALDCLIDVHDF